MKILVCLKQVPHKDARLEVAGDAGWIDEGGIKFEINQYDTYALEEALRIKDAGDAEVVVATIGPDRTGQALRTALGMGADRAIQVWGAAGVSGDLPLAAMYQGARTLRIADGPDEVHKILIAKNVLKTYHAGESWDFGH